MLSLKKTIICILLTFLRSTNLRNCPYGMILCGVHSTLARAKTRIQLKWVKPQAKSPSLTFSDQRNLKELHLNNNSIQSQFKYGTKGFHIKTFRTVFYFYSYRFIESELVRVTKNVYTTGKNEANDLLCVRAGHSEIAILISTPYKRS